MEDGVRSLNKELLLINAFGVKIWKNLGDGWVDDIYMENIPALFLSGMFCSLCLECASSRHSSLSYLLNIFIQISLFSVRPPLTMPPVEGGFSDGPR